MSTTNNLAYTAPVNPSHTTPQITASQLWNGLLLKSRSAQTFVGGAILSTTVLDESVNEEGNLVINREVVFRASPEKPVAEKVTAYEPCRVEFEQPNGSLISNVISEGAEGELYLTYAFKWMHLDMSDPEEVKMALEKEKKMAREAVEGSLVAVRKLVEEGKL
ncbi:hypothetical protein PDE_05736 [Penicillium oxalicum 114-2]|uniref:DUF1857-domain-containing protein n=1 Tax=Penicillium oxalicum (strain 114-2 / CGMCC 5302) TaxID=933388 RepID=S7ZKG3_PENO1|nr:hypothetical protein PDE_05736 [Penicillium oxalicum 114-2]